MDNTLQPTDPVPAEALNSVRLTSMLKTLQGQRETLANEVVNLTSEVDQVEFKFKREQNLVRQQQVELAEMKKAYELLDQMNTEQHNRLNAQDQELQQLRQTAADQSRELTLAKYELTGLRGNESTLNDSDKDIALGAFHLNAIPSTDAPAALSTQSIPAMTTSDIPALTDANAQTAQ